MTSHEVRKMKKMKAERLKKVGWRVGNTKQFLNLSDEEMALVEMKLALAHALKEYRMAQQLTQTDVANELGSSQSRVAKIGNPALRNWSM